MCLCLGKGYKDEQNYQSCFSSVRNYCVQEDFSNKIAEGKHRNYLKN